MYRFVLEITEEKLIVNKKKKAVLVKELRDRKYEAFPPKEKPKAGDDVEPEKEDNEEEDTTGGARDYDYLLSVCASSLSYRKHQSNQDRCLFGP